MTGTEIGLLIALASLIVSTLVGVLSWARGHKSGGRGKVDAETFHLQIDSFADRLDTMQSNFIIAINDIKAEMCRFREEDGKLHDRITALSDRVSTIKGRLNGGNHESR